MTTSSIIRIIAKNPASILIAGGFILIILGFTASPVIQGSGSLTFIGVACIALGIMLHLFWLDGRRQQHGW